MEQLLEWSRLKTQGQHTLGANLWYAALCVMCYASACWQAKASVVGGITSPFRKSC